MKILFFLLALANVALFMWEYRNGAFFTSPEIPAEASTGYQEQILLVDEINGGTLKAGQTGKTATIAAKSGTTAEPLPEKPSKSATPVLETPEATPNDPRITTTGQAEVGCFEAGPFASEWIYQAWEHRLNGFITGINRDEQTIKDYLVYYPAAETMEQSKENLQMLKDQGITDLWMFTQGAEQGQVSLGVFNREEQALTMKNELAAEGIKAEIKARYKTKIQKFALIKAETDVIDDLESLKKAYPKVIVKQTVGAPDRCL